MFCDGCGAAVQPGQAFCSRCGKQVVGTITAMQPLHGRVKHHLQLVGILWLAFSAFNVIGGIALLIVANVIFGRGRVDVPLFLHPLLTGIGAFVLAKAAVGLAGGVGLMQREPWARTLVLILAFISLFTSIPFGTALGVYTMWVLLPQESETEYDALVAGKAA